MRSNEDIAAKIAEIHAANQRKRRPNPERIDIIDGLKDVQKHGKYGTLRQWEERKKELKFMEQFLGDPVLKYGKRGWHGEIIPGDKMDRNAWKIGAYRWAMQIDDPEQMKMLNLAQNRLAQKQKEKKKEKKP